MNILNSYLKAGRMLATVSLLAMSSSGVQAAIHSIDGGAVVDLYAKQFQMATPDGDSFRMWGFANGAGGVPQYPAPTIRAPEGQVVQINVHNVDVPEAVTLDFPGQSGVQTSCDFGGVTDCSTQAGALQATTDSISYTFTASNPGTYLYQSGVKPQISVDMGLVGALIVDPVSTVNTVTVTNPDNTTTTTPESITVNGVTTPDFRALGLAYNQADTAYDREYLFFMSETDPKLHYLAELDKLQNWDNADYNATLFFFNGRNAPDTLAPDFQGGLPNQPYGALVTMHPGQRVLLRVINVGRNQHPLHTHGNHFYQIARDGNLIGSHNPDGSLNELRPVLDYTYGAVQGGTSDLIFHWTGKNMGWDIYGTGPGFEHSCDPVNDDTMNNITHAPTPDGFHDTTWEYCADHGKELPVVLPENLDLAFGGFWAGSPYLGKSGTLPVGEGGLNPAGGMAFLWHSHSERELTNNDIYPGGMLTMLLVVPYEEGANDVGQ